MSTADIGNVVKAIIAANTVAIPVCFLAVSYMRYKAGHFPDLKSSIKFGWFAVSKVDITDYFRLNKEDFGRKYLPIFQNYFGKDYYPLLHHVFPNIDWT